MVPGRLSAIDKLIENPPNGSRVRALAVAGAFHTKYMQSATSEVSDFVTKLSPNDPKVQLLSNRDGQVVSSGTDAISRIVNQIANPVRWDLCMQSLVELGVTGAIELAPAGTLAGLLKRAAASIETFTLKSPDDIDAAKEFAQRHNGYGG
jgi:[acyl-carrier-protein] S-malonyltransferase